MTEKNISGFIQIAKEHLDAPIEKIYLSEKEKQNLVKKLNAEAIELAEKIFDLSNNIRTNDKEIYIKTIKDVVLNRNSYENQFILSQACKYFEDKYGKELLRKGQSSSLSDQIIHRTGKESRKEIEELIAGFNVEKIAASLWNLIIRKNKNARKLTASMLYKLTTKQVRELRNTLNSFPARTLAQIIFSAISRKSTEGNSYPDIYTIRMILLGRTLHEVKQIEFQYNDIYHYQKNELKLREQIILTLDKHDAQNILTLLEGFKSNNVVEEIHSVLLNCAESCEIGRNDPNLQADFSGSFRHNYNHAPVWEKELRAYGAIDDKVKYLTKKQFEQVNLKLKHIYNEKLTYELYSSSKSFDARKKALDLYKSFYNVTPRKIHDREDEYLSKEEIYQVKEEFRLSNNKQIKEILHSRVEEIKAQSSENIIRMAIKPLEFLNLEQIQEIKDSFLYLQDIELDEFIKTSVNKLCQNEVPSYVNKLLTNTLQGILRINLKIDLFDLFLIEKNANTKDDIEKANNIVKNIKNILLSSDSPGNKGEKIKLELNNHDKSFLALIEKTYYKNEKSCLHHILKEKLNKDFFKIVSVRLEGVCPESIIEKIDKDISYIGKLTHLTNEAIYVIKKEFRNTKNIDIIKFVKDKNPQRKDYIRYFSVLFSPKVSELKLLLASKDALSEQELKKLNKYISLKSDDILAFEASYNRRYSKFEYCYERQFGTLLQRLRILASQKMIPRKDFSTAILLLEGLNEKITENLKTLLNNNNVDEVALNSVENILKKHPNDLKTIKKSYNAFDEELTLRETVYQLPIKLVEMNKLLLLLDGYNPDLIAKVFYDKTSKLESSDISNFIKQLLLGNFDLDLNLKLPDSTNWIDEMYNQIRISYEKQFGKKLISVLKNPSINLEKSFVNKMAYLLYGEASKLAIDLDRLLKSNIENKNIGLSLGKFLKNQVPAIREKIWDMYDAYFCRSLKRDLKTKFKDYPKIEKSLLSLLDESKTWDLKKKAPTQAKTGLEEFERLDSPDTFLNCL